MFLVHQPSPGWLPRGRRSLGGGCCAAAPLVGLVLLFGSEAAAAHSAWPDLHSAKLWLGCVERVDDDAEGVEPCRLDILATFEVPVAEMILAFRAEYEEIDLTVAVRSGEMEQLEEGFRRRQFERFANGLTVRRAGHEVPGTWRATDRLGNGYGIEGFFGYELRFAADHAADLIPVDRTVLSITNANLDRVPVMYANVVDPLARLRIVEASSPQPAPGVALEQGSQEEIALWSADDARRVFTVVLEPRAPKGSMVDDSMAEKSR